MNSPSFAISRWSAVGAAVLAAMGILFVTASVAQAEWVGNLVTVQASNSEGSASLSWAEPTSQGENGDAIFGLDGPMELRDGGNLIGTLTDLDVVLRDDPVVSLGFAATAGALPTTFTITSALLSFPALINPVAIASAGVTLTDGDPLPGNGASLSLVPPYTGLYQAEYNGGTTFAQLLGPVILPGPGSTSASAATPITSIPGSVSSILGRFAITLSAHDLASGTSTFDVEPFIPEPSTWVLLVCGLLSLVAMRRRIG